MSHYLYSLEPYKGPDSRYTCPRCKQPKQFVRYINTQTAQYLGQQVGRCNREVNCAYHYTPRQYFEQHRIYTKGANPGPTATCERQSVDRKAPTAYIDFDLFQQSLQAYEKNYFTAYLQKMFGTQKAQELITQFYIGTSKRWPGATIFWQIDLQGQVRTGKIMLYDPDQGKRVKKPFNHIHWVHKQLNLPDFQLEQCLFGLHQLLSAPAHQLVALVESEKTAIEGIPKVSSLGPYF